MTTPRASQRRPEHDVTKTADGLRPSPGGAPEAYLDDVAAAARSSLGGELAMVSLFDRAAGRQLIVGIDGLETGHEASRELPILESYSTYVHDNGCQLIVDDVSLAGEIASHPVTRTLGIQSWAGWPLIGTGGRPHDVLCVMDTRPRTWTSPEVFELERLANHCTRTIETHPSLHTWSTPVPTATDNEGLSHPASPSVGSSPRAT